VSRSLGELTALVAEVSDIYARLFEVDRNDDWLILKLQEELGELTAEHLRLTKRGRLKGQTLDEVEQSRADEAADLLAMLLLYARRHEIDLEAALDRKWFSYLKGGPNEGK
jgi:NTP pyrophosphatase (non-canonical NTP hydrolase)